MKQQQFAYSKQKLIRGICVLFNKKVSLLIELNQRSLQIVQKHLALKVPHIPSMPQKRAAVDPFESHNTLNWQLLKQLSRVALILVTDSLEQLQESSVSKVPIMSIMANFTPKLTAGPRRPYYIYQNDPTFKKAQVLKIKQDHSGLTRLTRLNPAKTLLVDTQIPQFILAGGVVWINTQQLYPVGFGSLSSYCLIYLALDCISFLYLVLASLIVVIQVLSIYGVTPSAVKLLNPRLLFEVVSQFNQFLGKLAVQVDWMKSRASKITDIFIVRNIIKKVKVIKLINLLDLNIVP